MSIVPAMSAGVGPWAYDLKVHESLLLSMMHGMVGVVPCRSQSVTRNSHEALLQLNASAEQGRFYINNNVIASKKGVLIYERRCYSCIRLGARSYPTIASSIASGRTANERRPLNQRHAD